MAHRRPIHEIGGALEVRREPPRGLVDQVAILDEVRDHPAHLLVALLRRLPEERQCCTRFLIHAEVRQEGRPARIPISEGRRLPITPVRL
jgi:hypothetical protein